MRREACYPDSNRPVLILRLLLEVDSATNLDPTRSVKLSIDHAEAGRILQVQIRVGKDDVIENVGEVKGQGELHLLGNSGVLPQGPVQVPAGEPAQDSPPGAPILRNQHRPEIRVDLFRICE